MVGESGSISIQWLTSQYASPKRSNVGSIFLVSKTDESPKEFLTMDRALSKDSCEWKDGGKYTSLLFQEAQEG